MSISMDGLAPVVQPFLDAELITEVGAPIKSGKEAIVLSCTAHPKVGHARLALKIYRPRAHRSFKNDASYRAGSLITRIGGGNTREARAFRRGSRFGEVVGRATWCGHEWEVLCELDQAGLPVPAPVQMGDNAILMELFECEDGRPAPPLAKAHLDQGSAFSLFTSLCRDIEDMLAMNLVHGDLSPFNVLWNGDEYRIIDFPQAVDPRFNGDAQQFLQRDLENVGRYCARAARIPDPAAIAHDMWQRFQSGEL